MRPDFEKISDRMEQASLKELMPDFNKDTEWQRLSHQLHATKHGASIPRWYYAAAVLLLLAGCIWFMLPSNSGDSGHQQTIVRQNNPPVQPTEVVSTVDTTSAIPQSVVKNERRIDTNTRSNKRIAVVKKRKSVGQSHNLVSSYTTKNFICNGTPCPIQICISQTLQCPHVEPATTSVCSTLEPDESGKLISHNKIAKNCSLTINELEIKSIATGETILLNTNTNPALAKEVFSYITGQKKGDVLAGMFNSDCDQKLKQHGIRINNKYGDVIIQ